MGPICSICNKTNPTTAHFCQWCGTALESTLTGLLPVHSLLHKGRYLITGKIGRGGMGAVYKAQDLELKQRFVAIKEMSQSGLNAQELQETLTAFAREAYLLTQLKHISLPAIYGQFEEQGRHYLVMEYIEGETLDQRLEKLQAQGKHLQPNEVLAIARQLCVVLEYLHTRQPAIIFRDLKPSNIMIDREEQIYLIDFGIARFFKPDSTKDTVALGSTGYAPPEQYRGATSPRSDIYSLGVTLRQMLTGEDPSVQPFQNKPFSVQMPALEQLILEMTALDERQRPTSMSRVLTELEQLSRTPQSARGGGNGIAMTANLRASSQIKGAPPILRPLIITALLSAYEQDQFLWDAIEQQLFALVNGFPEVEIYAENADAGQPQTIEQAHMIILMISDEFLVSSSCQTAMQRAIERSQTHKIELLGIVARASPGISLLQAQIPLVPEDALVHQSRYAQEQRLGEAARAIRAQLAAVLVRGKTWGNMYLLQWLVWQLYGNGYTTCRYFLIGDGQRDRYALHHVRSAGIASILVHLVDLHKRKVITELLIGPLRCQGLTRLLHIIAPLVGDDLEQIQGLATRQRPVW